MGGLGHGEYPKPMLDFNERRETCIQAMKNAYHVGLYGNDPKVLDGSWRTLFGDGAEGPTEGTKGPTEGTKGPPGAMVEHEEVDGDGEEHDAPEPMSPKKAKKVAAKSEKKVAPKKAAPGHKREASQSTLDGMVTRKKGKKEDVFPNDTHFG